MNDTAMTKDEFVRRWVGNSGLTEADLEARGRYPLPCDCGEPGCYGWQMAYRSDDEDRAKGWM